MPTDPWEKLLRNLVRSGVKVAAHEIRRLQTERLLIEHLEKCECNCGAKMEKS